MEAARCTGRMLGISSSLARPRCSADLAAPTVVERISAICSRVKSNTLSEQPRPFPGARLDSSEPMPLQETGSSAQPARNRRTRWGSKGQVGGAASGRSTGWLRCGKDRRADPSPGQPVSSHRPCQSRRTLSAAVLQEVLRVPNVARHPTAVSIQRRSSLADGVQISEPGGPQEFGSFV